MIVDTSALAAILFDERDAQAYARAIADAETSRLSAANFVEAAIVVQAQTRNGTTSHLDALIRRAGIIIEPVTEEQAHLARQAYTDFGKGRHQAGLNFGDCFAYALAKLTAEPLLFKGEDFGKTDITSALSPATPRQPHRSR
jgi:ribonuclease VapC